VYIQSSKNSFKFIEDTMLAVLIKSSVEPPIMLKSM